ncbi:hypothetical protein OJ997_34310 [Solirubrobacter phytolaccae]|uniref:DUF3558 domain-containing protein n=1 Tax=Solirubrobacter phytolaccae TaxID=1404360 RepID=A0A9X3NG16_9ACTN|nr:hypothetical protein [Solirubrobacter phytolaccae]MDA0185431.1 hypothetical protein [Solirubrobacter phytolaccae]
MKKLLITTALAFAAVTAPAAAAPTLTGTATLDNGHTFTCTWTQIPEGEDCLAIVGDAADEVRLLQRHGATSATFTVDATAIARGVITRTVERRTDGTWLMRGSSTAHDKRWGFVCAGTPLRCAMWEGGTKKTIAKATKKVTRKS